MRYALYLSRVLLLMFVFLFIGILSNGAREILLKSILILLILDQLHGFLRMIVYGGAKGRLANLSLMFSVTVFVFLVFETAFIFVARSHTVGYTKASERWLEYHWRRNSYGFRDTEPVKDKPSVFFVGDSFMAGHGINDPKDRFSDIVGQRLKGLHSINIGQGGVDTKREFELMSDFISKSKISPDVIVLQYYGNDIVQAALNNGLTFDGFEPYKNLNRAVRFAVKGSHLFNYIYWLYPQQDVSSYVDFLSLSYGKDDVLKEHFNDLDRFVDYSRERGIQLIPVVIPFLTDLELSDRLYVSKIVSHFKEKGIQCINVSELIRKYGITDLVVNNNDEHASEEVNSAIADELVGTMGSVAR